MLNDALFVASRELPDGGVILLATDGRDENSATTVEEARWLEDNGCDAVIAQGYEAGGHRGMFLNDNLNAQLLLAETRLDQSQRLLERRAGSEYEVQQYQSQVDSLKAQIDTDVAQVRDLLA